MPFNDLDEHAITHILSWCNVHTVISFTRLVEEIKRVVVGPKTWSPCSSSARLKRQLLVRIDQPGYMNIRGSVSVLPGGRYFTIDDWVGGKFGVWEVETERCLWNGPPKVSFPTFEMKDGGKTVFGIFFVHRYHRTVQIARINLLSGDSNDIFSLPLPGHLHDMTQPVLSGDFFAHNVRIGFDGVNPGRPAALLVVNWRKEMYAFIDCAFPLTARPGFYHSIALIWRPINNPESFWSRFAPQEGLPILCARLELDGSPLRDAKDVELAVYASPLHRFVRGALRRGPAIAIRSALFSYYFAQSTPRERGPTWVPLSVVPAAYFPRGPPPLTYSGYGIDKIRTHTVFVDARLERDGRVSKVARQVIPCQIAYAQLALGTYSAAVPDLRASPALGPSLRISYYD
ncbi:hypothetical protein B0H17DRAFT_1199201 [Mycena rosella]|uniref:Uncharacterized protein n=1 Tax=Mycena rosella TaxID=1033263 RepID=A0AAD7DL59_MYCRO|nr:hypothetical protein B0H17DRAFT_1199201 [Mycena rosella]